MPLMLLFLVLSLTVIFVPCKRSAGFFSGVQHLYVHNLSLMKKKEKHKKNKETEEKKVDKKITYCHVYQCGFEKARQYLCVDGF